jgi:hypothetical protein
MPDRPDDLDQPVSDEEQAILDMVLALKKRDGRTALSVAEQALRGAAGNTALEARVLTWWGQALRWEGNETGARERWHAARSKAEGAGDTEGVAAVDALLAEIGPAPAPMPASVGEPSPVGLAVEALDAGDLPRGELLALGAHRLAHRAGDAREEVLALLALARIPHRTAAALEEAARVADEAEDRNLVTAVAKARKAAGLPPRKHVF